LEGEYIAMEVARAVLSPVAAVSALCAAADTEQNHFSKAHFVQLQTQHESLQQSAICAAADTEQNHFSTVHVVQLQTQNKITSAKRTLCSCRHRTKSLQQSAHCIAAHRKFQVAS